MKTTRKPLTIKASPEDLDDLRAIFECMACDPQSPGSKLAKRMMRAVHECRKKHGFKWIH